MDREMTEDGWTAVRDGTGDGCVSTDFLVRRRERLTMGVSDVDLLILGIGPVEPPVALGYRRDPPHRIPSRRHR
jgi:hypothetical protein